MEIILNPGSGPVEHASQVVANVNMEIFRQDVKEKHGYKDVSFTRFREDDSAGRYGYTLMCDTHVFNIEMPGLPILQVRWMRLPGQNIWDFPRLYVDGTSWFWLFAINNCGPDEEQN